MAYIMFKEKIEEQKANLLVKEALIERNYYSNLELKRYLLDDDVIEYFIIEEVTYHGERMPKITRLTCSEYMKLLGKRLSLQSGAFYCIYPEIKKNLVYYQVEETDKPLVRRKQRGK